MWVSPHVVQGPVVPLNIFGVVGILSKAVRQALLNVIKQLSHYLVSLSHGDVASSTCESTCTWNLCLTDKVQRSQQVCAWFCGLGRSVWPETRIPNSSLKDITSHFPHKYTCQTSCPCFGSESMANYGGQDPRMTEKEEESERGLGIKVPWLLPRPPLSPHPPPPCFPIKAQERIQDPSREPSGSLGSQIRKDGCEKGVWGKGAEVTNSGGESEREVAQSCPTLCNPMDCSLPGSSTGFSK